jgi:hypothetical protein
MKITVDIPDNDIKDILRFSGEKKKGPAIARLVANSLMLERRREMCEEVVSGKWTIALPDWRKTRAKDREHDRKLLARW